MHYCFESFNIWLNKYNSLKSYIFLFFLFCASNQGRAQANLEVAINVHSSSYIHPGYSPYTKSGILKGFNIKYSKASAKPWFFYTHYASGNLKSEIDGSSGFFDFYPINISFGKYFNRYKQFQFGFSLSLLDGYVAESKFPNNRYVHDLSLSGLKGLVRHEYKLSSKFKLVNSFALELFSLHFRNSYSTRASLRFRPVFPNKKFGVYYSFGVASQNTEQVNWFLRYKITYVQSSDLAIKYFQNGLEIGLLFPIMKKIRTNES